MTDRTPAELREWLEDTEARLRLAERVDFPAEDVRELVKLARRALTAEAELREHTMTPYWTHPDGAKILDKLIFDNSEALCEKNERIAELEAQLESADSRNAALAKQHREFEAACGEKNQVIEAWFDYNDEEICVQDFCNKYGDPAAGPYELLHGMAGRALASDAGKGILEELEQAKAELELLKLDLELMAQEKELQRSHWQDTIAERDALKQENENLRELLQSLVEWQQSWPIELDDYVSIEEAEKAYALWSAARATVVEQGKKEKPTYKMRFGGSNTKIVREP